METITKSLKEKGNKLKSIKYNIPNPNRIMKKVINSQNINVIKLCTLLILILICKLSSAQSDSTGSLMVYGKTCGISTNNKFEEGGENYLFYKDGICMFNISKILKSPAMFRMINYRNNRIGDSSNYEIQFQCNPKNSSSILFNISIFGNRKNVGIKFLHNGTNCNFVDDGDKKKETEIIKLFSTKLKTIKL